MSQLRKLVRQALLQKSSAAAVTVINSHILQNYVFIKSERSLPENEMVDFELGLYHACRPQSYSQNVCLCGHVIWRRDAGDVLKETTKRGRGGGGREREVKDRGDRQRERNTL